MLGEDRVDPLFSTSELAEIYAAAAQPVSHVKDLEADEDIFELTRGELVLIRAWHGASSMSEHCDYSFETQAQHATSTSACAYGAHSRVGAPYMCRHSVHGSVHLIVELWNVLQGQ